MDWYLKTVGEPDVSFVGRERMKRSKAMRSMLASARGIAGRSLISFSLCWGAQTLQATEPVPDSSEQAAELERFFESEVRPLLLDACGECHGARKAESGLRLDNQASLRIGGDSGPVIDTENPEQSLLLQVIGDEGDFQMPPDRKLSSAQIAVLRKWVQLGAPWPGERTEAANPLGLRSGPITDAERRHWAYQPVRKPAVPDLASTLPPSHAALVNWAETDIDRFVLAGLAAQGLYPAEDAPRQQWLRRLTFDLIGLPPTPEAMADFLADDTPEAYANAIDRLLELPQYGERWGRHWLDLVRYADTAGDGADYPIREAYRYRDYVIESFNADKPYDEFVREQIAGDILAHQAAANGEITPERFAELVTATGYIAITKRFGYNINTEFQHLDIADTIDNLGHVFLGLSIGCARCHDHKYDAVTAEDYYALYGIFSSSQYSFPGGEEYKRPHNLVPLALPEVVAAAQQRTTAMLAALDEQAALHQRQRDELLSQVRLGVSSDPGWELQVPGKPGGAPWFTAGPNTVSAEAQSPYTHVYPAGGQGIRIGYGAPTDGIRQEFADVTARQSEKFYFNIDFRNVQVVEGDGGYRFYLGRGAITSLALECSINSHEFAVRNGDEFQVVRKLEPGVWYNLQLAIDMKAKTFSGRIGRPGDVVDFNDFAMVPGWDGVLNTFVSDGFGRDKSTSPTRDIDNVVGQLKPFAPLPDPTAEQSATESSLPDLTTIKQRLQEIDSELQRIAAERAAVPSATDFPMAYGVAEGTPMDARLQRRGEPNRLDAVVPRRFLEILGGDRLPPDATGSGRLELAQWLTRPSNPLTARVIVNRVWQYLLGRGLVDTPNDFGVRGQPPSHPELLDFMTAEFIADGWSIKRLQRRILNSHVYRISSVATPEQMELDPGNRWFAKHRRRALDAEAIRDAMLAVSGRLNYAPGGPHPFPSVESWGFTIHYPFHAVYESDHRSVYLMIQRSRRHPFLSLFDAADPNISTATRDVSITPTQSLYLMNAPFVHAQASGLAQRLIASHDQDAEQNEGVQDEMIRQAYWLTLSREASEQEVMRARQFLSESRHLLSSNENAWQLAWEAFCRVLMTSNEFLYVD